MSKKNTIKNTKVIHPKKDIKKTSIKKIVDQKSQKKMIDRLKKTTDTQSKDDVNIAAQTINKKVVIVHGWDGDISKGWFPWLKKTLEEQGFKVIMEQMPDSHQPEIKVWTEALKNISGNVDDQTYFVGHSIGCQTIIRMLENHESPKAGGAVFLAGWFNLKEQMYTENPKSEKTTRQTADPWVNTQIDFTKVQPKFSPGSVTAIFSDDDPYVDLNNAEAFKQKFDARIIVESAKGHFNETEIDMIPVLVQEILRIAGKK